MITPQTRRRGLAALAAAACLGGATATTTATTAAAATAATTGARSAGPAIPGDGFASPATMYADSLLHKVNLPPGSMRTSLRSLPATARDPWEGAVGAVTRARAFLVPASTRSTEAYLLAHAPAGTDTTGTGTREGAHGQLASEWVFYHIADVPKGVAEAEVQVYVISHGTGMSLVGAFAHVAGVPARSAAELVTAAKIEEVRIRVNGGTDYTFTTRPVIARLARALNELRVAGDTGPTSCMGSATTYQITFIPRAESGKVVLVTAYSCDYDDVSVGGVTQPPLNDPANRISALAARLTGTRQYTA